MLWLRQKTAAPLSTVLAVAGALCFFAGVFLTLYWDRKRKKALEEENNKK
jgi:hypothetical protein